MNKKKLFKIIFLTAVVMFFAVLVFLGLYGNYKIANEPVDYAIGKITNYKAGGSVAPSFDYVFYLNEKEYENTDFITDKLGRESSDSLRKYIGKLFFVKFNEDNPRINRLLLDMPVWEGIEQPPAGWDELPKE